MHNSKEKLMFNKIKMFIFFHIFFLEKLSRMAILGINVRVTDEIKSQ